MSGLPVCGPISFIRFHFVFHGELEPKCEVFLLMTYHILLVTKIKKSLLFPVSLCSLLQQVAFSFEMCRCHMFFRVRAFNLPVGLLSLLLEELALLIRMCSIAYLFENINCLLLCGACENFL